MTQLAGSFRRMGLRLFSHLNPGDVTISHHYTGDRLRIHSFRHKDYWFKGRQREERTMEMFHALVTPGSVVFDVGAHIGYLTLWFAKLAAASGRVFSFEPSPLNLAYLKQNVCGKTNVTIVEKGVGRSSGNFEFYIEDLTGQNCSFVPNFEMLHQNANATGVHPNVKTIVAEMTTLDEFVDAQGVSPDFIKIDVEGFEYNALCGSNRVLEEHRPMLMVEVWREPSNRDRVYQYLQSQGYLMFSASGRINRSGDQLSLNTFCLHPEKHTGAVRNMVSAAVLNWRKHCVHDRRL